MEAPQDRVRNCSTTKNLGRLTSGNGIQATDRPHSNACVSRKLSTASLTASGRKYGGDLQHHVVHREGQLSDDICGRTVSLCGRRQYGTRTLAKAYEACVLSAADSVEDNRVTVLKKRAF